MVSNYNLCKSWIQLASDDFLTAVDSMRAKRNGIAVYHIQQVTEKLCKAILAFFGRESRKTHFPTAELSELLKDEFVLDSLFSSHPEKKDLITKSTPIITEIIALARSIEDEATRPRYGIRHADAIILPQKLYSYADVELFFKDMKRIAMLLKTVFELQGITKTAILIEDLKIFLEEKERETP